jgi:hypothetical protein
MQPGALSRRSWNPVAVESWILHVVHGHSMRRIARAWGIPTSTVLRRVRRIEDLCDDVTLENGLTALAERHPLQLGPEPGLDWPDLEAVCP